MKPIAPLLCLFLLLAGSSRADSTPSAELQTRLVNELHLEFIPRNPQREAAGYWHFWANVGSTGLDVYVPEGSTLIKLEPSLLLSIGYITLQRRHRHNKSASAF